MTNLTKKMISLTGVAACMLPGVAQAQQKPNIICILVDDLGYGDLSCQGYAQDIRTPHIDKLLNEGVRFTNFYANSNISSPSRAALLTGRYPDCVGVPGVIRTHPEDSWGGICRNRPYCYRLYLNRTDIRQRS